MHFIYYWIEAAWTVRGMQLLVSKCFRKECWNRETTEEIGKEMIKKETIDCIRYSLLVFRW